MVPHSESLETLKVLHLGHYAVDKMQLRALKTVYSGADPGGAPGAQAPPMTTKNEAPAPKFYKTEAPEWQF